MRWTWVGNRATRCGHGPSVTGAAATGSHTHRWHLSNVTQSRRHFLTIGNSTRALPIIIARIHAQPSLFVRWLSSPSGARVKQHVLDRDVMVSVLEAVSTKRDAKNYLQKYASKWGPSPAGIDVMADQNKHQKDPPTIEPVNVAIMSLKAPQDLDDITIRGIAKTLAQLRTLGLLSVVVTACGTGQYSVLFEEHQALRLCEAVDAFGSPGAKLAHGILSRNQQYDAASPFHLQNELFVEDRGLLQRALQNNMVVVVPSIASHGETLSPQQAESHNSVLALAKYFTGTRPQVTVDGVAPSPIMNGANKIASVERIIILDPLGGTPVPGRPGTSQRFVNLQQEYHGLFSHLMGPLAEFSIQGAYQTRSSSTSHAANLKLAKDTLSLLPATSSALITTPYAAANCTPPTAAPALLSMNDDHSQFDGEVTTRKKQNPLLHNLLTDKPVFSSSLPVQRTQARNKFSSPLEDSVDATLVKRGMPLSIYPDPRINPWVPPTPGSPRPRLTDSCVDLPRLVHLIEDSFGHELDVEEYLNRVKDSLAGIIIAGEYEGGAILTWETPQDIHNNAEKRFVPYLDKFAVLRSRQGSGGVADIVFNAMVRDCFPHGVCWRSRKNNPVNKWYFERSAGTSRISDSNWTMFWTTPGLVGHHPTLQDYESVCRGVVATWSSNQRAQS